MDFHIEIVCFKGIGLVVSRPYKEKENNGENNSGGIEGPSGYLYGFLR